jgi:hypothetical protein
MLSWAPATSLLTSIFVTCMTSYIPCISLLSSLWRHWVNWSTYTVMPSTHLVMVSSDFEQTGLCLWWWHLLQPSTTFGWLVYFLGLHSLWPSFWPSAVFDQPYFCPSSVPDWLLWQSSTLLGQPSTILGWHLCQPSTPLGWPPSFISWHTCCPSCCIRDIPSSL